MGATSKIYNVVIASPGDLTEERKLVRETINEWNTKNAERFGIVFLPKMWEINSIPEVGDRPQAILNRQLISTADVMIAMFWSRLGSPTGEYESGTIEEIEQFVSAHKPVALYFSRQKVDPWATDIDQLKRLDHYRKQISSTALYHEFKDCNELKNKVLDFLTHTQERLQSHTEEPVAVDQSNTETAQEREDFSSALKIASLSNANGFWLSVVCDYRGGYTSFQSKEKRHVISWAERLCEETVYEREPSKRVGKGLVHVYSPSAPPQDFIFHYHNDGLVTIKWRGDSDQISLMWIMIRLTKTLRLLLDDSLVDNNRQPQQIGFSIGNAPEHGIQTDEILGCIPTRSDFKQMSSIWKSEYGKQINIDEYIRSFVHNLLEEWGYLDFEEPLSALSIEHSLPDFLAEEQKQECLPDINTIEDALLNDFVDSVINALNDHLDDTSNITISRTDTEVQEVMVASVDSLDSVVSLDDIESDEPNRFTATASLSVLVEIKDFFGSEEIADIVTLDFELHLAGTTSEDGNIDSITVTAVEQI
ncbi:hypothetical protein [Paenibacillus lautus]|nr:hypothetical protein [Paenibacillus lautus]MEC0259794.1 hypothetical protein [Paenibacillus lautus]